jgi:class 3 adenylate cyclase
LKVGLHAGPCIVVTLNHRLDYFGGTVNIASRLSGLAQGNDLIISHAVLEEPEANRVITTFPALVDEEVELRGLTGSIHVHRIVF